LHLRVVDKQKNIMTHASDRTSLRAVPYSSSRSGTTIEEYGSINVTVVENQDHEAVVVHDFAGPVLIHTDTVERRDSIVSTIGCAVVLDDDNYDADGNPDSSTTATARFLSEHPDTGYGGQASIPSEIASMTKNLIGCGALSLCNGLALCANAPGAVAAGIFWIAVMGAVFGYMCWLIAKVCAMTGRQTYRGVWQATVGHNGAIAVSVANALKAALADLAYATILADTVRSLLLGFGGWRVPRVACLLLVTVIAILPLCMLRNLHVLAPFSVVGTGGVFLTSVAMAVRYLDGSYLPGGTYHDDLPKSLQPHFGSTNNSWSIGILPFVCMVYEVRNFGGTCTNQIWNAGL
jgi:Transmembrane amino acid transporter protein